MRRLRGLMDRFFEGDFLDAPTFHSLYEGIAPVDVFQTADDVVVKAVLPGVGPEDLSISVTGDTLTIRGEVSEFKKSAENGKSDREYHVHERRYSRFSRSLVLPTTVNSDQAEAEMENGILTLTLPKAEEVKPKTITVKAK